MQNTSKLSALKAVWKSLVLTSMLLAPPFIVSSQEPVQQGLVRQDAVPQDAVPQDAIPQSAASQGAESQEASSEQQTPAEDDSEIEVISVQGRNNDAATRAFRLGDFELAQEEFRKNARCAVRQERALEAFVVGLQNSSITQGTQGGVNSASNTTANGGAFVASSPLITSLGGNAGNQDDSSAQKNLSCTDPAYQLYMAGLSFVQLGRLEEAEKNFRRAAAENKRLYDAHYRIALLSLLQEDASEAESRLSRLKSLQESCGKCDAEQEILARVSHIEKALSGEVKLR